MRYATDPMTHRHQKMQRLAALALVGLLALVLSACRTTAGEVDRFEFPTNSDAHQRLEAWFAGEASVGLEDLDLHTPHERFVAAEVAYWKGDVELSYELLAPMLRAYPGHPLNRFVAARLYDLQTEVVDFHRRARVDLEGIKYEGELPLTRLYLSMLGHDVRHEEWRRSDARTPFDAGVVGFSSEWMLSPMMSPWRLLDFETSFGIEDEPHMGAAYISPQVAIEDPANERPTRPHHATGTSVSPGLSPAGIYYLETFLHLEEDRAFWVYGNFAPATLLWIGGEEVFRREEKDYSIGKRFRRVELGAGTHRILVKIANQPRYRDWFDLRFIDDGAGPLIDAPLEFSRTPLSTTKPAGSVRLGRIAFEPSELEALLTKPNEVSRASSAALYLSAVVAYQNGQPEYFEPAWEELMERHQGFAAGYALKSAQIQTLWDVPSELRDSAALSLLRAAHLHDAESLHVILRLAGWLKDRGNEREVRQLLESARTLALRPGATLSLENEAEFGGEVHPLGPRTKLRNGGAFADWASYLGSKGWREPSEKAWRELLAVAPTHCQGASNLQTLYYGRQYFPDLSEITPAFEACPELAHRYDNEHPDRAEARLDLVRREAERYPYSPQRQLRLVRALVSAGAVDEARAVVDETLGRVPDSLPMWNELANIELRVSGREQAAEVLRHALNEHGNNGWALWRIATLDGQIPLLGIMPDGHAAAMAEVRRAGIEAPEEAEETSLDEVPEEGQAEDGQAAGLMRTGDEAYYVVDFAARQYFPDGSHLTVTHTVVRVMTKGAIDRFGETSVPSNARLLLARTIKQDGTVLVPEEVAGKSTLSMPTLAEGDLVEIAYLQYGGRSEVASHIEDLRFFFRMNDISTRHSEYIVLGAPGIEFMRMNDAPALEPYTFEGIEGARFVARDNPRPRQEPYGVSTFEHLPWVQGFRSGISLETFEAERRYVADTVLDSLRMSSHIEAQIAEWLGEERQGNKPVDQDVHKLFYGVSQWFSNPSLTAFGTEASHALLGRRGSSLVVLKTALDHIDVEAELYLVKSAQQIPEVYPVGEFGKYRRALLRVTLPESGEVVWLEPSGPDASFGVYSSDLFGQSATCVSCVEGKMEVVPALDPARRHVLVEGRLTDEGNLLGTATYTFTGSRAVAVRGALRARSDDTNRQKYFEAVLADLFAGANLVGYDIEDEGHPERPLMFRLEFERPNFARATSGTTMQVETNLFREGIATVYTPLSTRTLPLFVGYERAQSYALRIELPSSREVSLRSRAGTWELASEFGQYSRTVNLEGNTLRVESAIALPMQRVAVDDYAAFQQWAHGVEQSGVLFFQMR